MSTASLPDGFAHLEELTDWCLATMLERSARRQASEMADLTALYDALLPHMPAVLDHLAGYDTDTAPDDTMALFRLAQSFAEVAPAVERFGRPDVEYGFDPSRFTPRPD